MLHFCIPKQTKFRYSKFIGKKRIIELFWTFQLVLNHQEQNSAFFYWFHNNRFWRHKFLYLITLTGVLALINIHWSATTKSQTSDTAKNSDKLVFNIWTVFNIKIWNYFPLDRAAIYMGAIMQYLLRSDYHNGITNRIEVERGRESKSVRPIYLYLLKLCMYIYIYILW